MLRRWNNLFRVLTVLFLVISMASFTALPTFAATYFIAASNSSAGDKSIAHVICDGTSDQTEINEHLTAGNTVQLAAGTYNIDGYIIPTTGSHLYGQGNTTIINLSGAAIYVSGASNVEIDHLLLTGASWASGAIFIGKGSGFYIHDTNSTALGGDGFVLYANNGTISDVQFVRCDVNAPDGWGFLINGEGAPSTVENVVFFQCSVENAGVAASRVNDWVVGFSLAEYANMTVDSVYVIDSSVDGAWESDFHMEIDPTKTNIVITDCSAENAGLKAGGSTYGAGYLVDGLSDVILNDNTGASNDVADIRAWNGATYDNTTPAANMIFPAASAKITTDVLQANCDGVIIDLDATHKELVFYSNNGNPVDQHIDLGGFYIADDGGTYTFDGKEIVAQFTDYIIIQLVESTEAPTVATNAATGVATTTATLNGNLSDLGASDNVTVSFEYGETIAYGSSVAADESPMITTGSFHADLAGLDPSKEYHFRAKAVGYSTVYGADETFITAAIGDAPSVSTLAETNIGIYSVTFNGNLTDLGFAGSVAVTFEYGLTLSYGSSITADESPMGAIGAFHADATGLVAGSTYHYRAKAVGDGTTYGNDETFDTLPAVPATPTTLNASVTSIVNMYELVFAAMGMVGVIGYVFYGKETLIFRVIIAAVIIYVMIAFLPGLNDVISGIL